MHNLLLCIACNVLVFVILKLISKKGLNQLPVIVINYWTCALLGSLFFCDFDVIKNSFATPPDWFIYTVFMGLLFIVSFNAIAVSIKNVGIAITSMLQRLAFIATVVFGLFFLREQIDFLRYIGLALGLIGVVMVTYEDQRQKQGSNNLLIPLTVFVLSSFIDILFAYLSKTEKALPGDYMPTTSIFLFAALFGTAYWLIKSRRLTSKEVVGGVLLGLPNFFSIYFIFECFHLSIPSSKIAPILNIGILATSAIVGWLVFQERFSLRKKLGLLIAITAVLLFLI